MGEEIEVIDPAGAMLTVRLEVVAANRVEGAIVAEQPHDPEPKRRVTVAIANLPATALELVLSRCTEAGAFAFVVFQSDRSVARGQKLQRWHAICREATMLSGRLRVPDVVAATSLEEAIREAENPVMLVRGAQRRLDQVASQGEVTLLIGPEGGWTERELALAPRKATLGPRNLRADTAALVGLAVALSQEAGGRSGPLRGSRGPR